MRKSSVLKPFAVAAGLAVLAFPAFVHSEGGSDTAGAFTETAAAQPMETEPPQLPGSGEMATTDRTGTTGPSGSEAFLSTVGQWMQSKGWPNRPGIMRSRIPTGTSPRASAPPSREIQSWHH